MIIFVQWVVGIIGFRLTYKVNFFSIRETVEILQERKCRNINRCDNICRFKPK